MTSKFCILYLVYWKLPLILSLWFAFPFILKDPYHPVVAELGALDFSLFQQAPAMAI
jgi:hypothetical protein